MRTHYVGSVSLDEARLAKDLDRCLSLPWSEAYSDYVFGGSWKSCMLWARGGDAGDGVVTNYAYDRSPTFTENAEQLPYLRELVERTADLTRLNFVRLALVARSVIIPHRDLLELSELADDVRNAHRMHIPLATNDSCFFGEDNVVYRMRQGEVWFLDASQIHTVAVLSDEQRIHLMYDFVNMPGDGPLTTVEGSGESDGIPAEKIVPRPPLRDDERAELLGLSTVLTMDTVDEIFSMVIKKHFRRDGGDGFIWNTMLALARESRDPAVLPHVTALMKHYTLERSA
jgi:hypothetical protein